MVVRALIAKTAVLMFRKHERSGAAARASEPRSTFAVDRLFRSPLQYKQNKTKRENNQNATRKQRTRTARI